MIYDEEEMLKDVENLFKKEFNNQISCINTMKGAVIGDDLFLDDIESDQYVFETIDKSLLNFRGFFVLYGLMDSPLTSSNIESDVIGTTITFQVGVIDRGDKERKNILYKLLRYRRAIIQVFKKNPDVFRGYAKPLVKAFKPESLPLDNHNVILKSGVDVTASSTSN